MGCVLHVWTVIAVYSGQFFGYYCSNLAEIFFAGRCPAPRWGSRPRPQLPPTLSPRPQFTHQLEAPDLSRSRCIASGTGKSSSHRTFMSGLPGSVRASLALACTSLFVVRIATATSGSGYESRPSHLHFYPTTAGTSSSKRCRVVCQSSPGPNWILNGADPPWKARCVNGTGTCQFQRLTKRTSERSGKRASKDCLIGGLMTL